MCEKEPVLDTVVEISNRELDEECVADDEQEEFIHKGRYRKKSENITLTLNRKTLAKDTAITAKRHKIGIVAQRDILANIVNAGGGNVEEVSLSKSTVHTAGTAMVKKTAEDIRKNFKTTVKSSFGSKEALVIHFDEKSLAQYHDNVKSVEKRPAIIANSPYLTKEQVLGVPIIASNSGAHQKDAVMRVLEDWELKPHVMGLGFDTTSDNTGKNKGAVVLIEKAFGVPLLWVPCPHHMYELHAKKVTRLCLGSTTNPEETFYKTLRDNWNHIIKEGINCDNLEVFDWEKWEATFMFQQASETKTFLLGLFSANTFSRGDSKELLSLVLIWLGEDIPNFKFQYPGALSHARFLMQAIYSVKIILLSGQLDCYTAEEIEKVRDIATFVGLFYASWYFKCPLASGAPMLHLESIIQMKQLEQIMPELAKVVLESIRLHLWYLTPQNIPLALADESLPTHRRMSLAIGLSNVTRTQNITLGKPQFPDLSDWPDNFWLTGQSPAMESFLGPASWLIFNKLGFTSDMMDWLSLSPEDWESNPNYIRFKDFIKNLKIVNDPA